MENGVTPSPLALSIKISAKRDRARNYRLMSYNSIGKGFYTDSTNQFWQVNKEDDDYFRAEDDYKLKIRSHVKYKNTVMEKIKESIMENRQFNEKNRRISRDGFISLHRLQNRGYDPDEDEDLKRMKFDFNNDNEDDDGEFYFNMEKKEEENKESKIEDDEEEDEKDMAILGVLKSSTKDVAQSLKEDLK